MDPDLREQIESWTPNPDATPTEADWFPPIFEDAPFGIAAIDILGNFARVNRACAELHGRTVEEMHGANALEMSGDPSAAADYEQTLAAGRDGMLPHYEAEHELRHADGRSRWALIKATVVHDTDGNAAYFLIQYNETTNEHILAEEIRATSEAYHLTVDTAPIAIYSVDLAGRVVDWNPKAEELFGWSADEVIGQNIPILTDEGRDEANEGFGRLIAGETIPAIEATLRHKDGSYIHVVTSASVTHGPHGEPERIVAFTLDITAQQQAEAELVASEVRLRTILGKIADTVTVVGPDGMVKFSTGEYSDVLGYPEDFWVDRDIFSIIAEDDRDGAAKLFEELLENPSEEYTDVFRLRTASGTYDPIEVVGVNLIDDPEVGGIVLTTRNLTEFRRTKELLADEAGILELIARGADLSEILDGVTRMIERNTVGGLTGIVLFDDEGLMRISSAPGIPDELLAEVEGWVPYGLFAQARESGETIIIADSDSDPRVDEESPMVLDWALTSGWVTPIVEPSSGSVLGVIATYFSEPDATTDDALRVAELGTHLASIAIERSRAHQVLNHQAHHDSLTGLPNRLMIMNELKRVTADPKDGRQVAVMILDLDRFKVVNDSLGHLAGDALLGMFADRLRGLESPGIVVGRFSADEFVVIVDENKAGLDVGALASRLNVMLSEPFTLDAGDIYLSASIGVTTTAGDTTAGALLEQASAAMYEAKQRGRDRLEVFDHRMRTRARDRMELERDLRQAVEHDQLVLHYQPKIDLLSGAVIGAEALLRWKHPERGLILPDDFIPVAEETGLIVRIGRWVLEDAIKQSKAWVDQGQLDHFIIGVNFSPRQISAPDLINNLGRVLLKYGWPPDRLSVELTETILIDDADGSLEVLQQLKNLGVKLTIDDFGTGYSSLSYLDRFPVDIVKIDRAFVAGLRADGTGSAVAAAVMQMAEAFNIIVAGEGVESADQLQGLRALGCDWAQGFYFARPLPPDEFLTLLAAAPTW